jgi:hypothetical protein
MAAQNAQKRQKPDMAMVGNFPDLGAIDRLTERRQKLARQMEGLENKLIETGRKIAGLDETLYRLRQKARPQPIIVR